MHVKCKYVVIVVWNILQEFKFHFYQSPGCGLCEIEELEVEKKNIEGNEGEEGEEKMKEKGKEVVYISSENELLRIGMLLKKKETIEAIVQNSVWEYQDKTIGMDT